MTLAEANEAKRPRQKNTRLKYVMSDQAMDVQFLKEAASGNF